MAGEVDAQECFICKSRCALAEEVCAASSLYKTSKFCGGLVEGGEAGRLAALESLNMLDTPREHVFDAITDLMKKVFNTPASHMVLIDSHRCWFKSWTGSWHEFECNDGQGPYVQCPREDGWCDYILVPTAAELLVIEDAQKDARVSLNAFVVGPPHFRFYAGAPLVGSAGERYGTLCVVDFVPRTFTAEQYALLVNYAALAVEELERNKPLLDKVGKAAVNIVENNRHLDLSIQAAREGLLMLDMRDSSWPIVYANPTFAATTGLALDALLGNNFWDLFEHGSKSVPEIGLYVGLGDTFEMEVVCVSTRSGFTLRFLTATSDRLAPSKATGLPASAPFKVSQAGESLYSPRSDGKPGEIFDHVKCYWFAVMCDRADLAGKASTHYGSEGGSSLSSVCTSDVNSSVASVASLASVASAGGCVTTCYCEYHLPPELGIQGLGPLLGSGSFGKVYRATDLHDVAVAVKVVDCRQRQKEWTEAQIREIQFSSSLKHPHLIDVLAYGVSRDIVGSKQLGILWLVQELCDLGTLTRCVERGFLRQERKLTSPACMTTVIQTLMDVASAMKYVHAHGVIHADLTGRNVLLSSREGTQPGFVAKVGDFGLSRYTHGQAMPTKELGTITHMPPELLRLKDPLLVPAADVWAFGIIAWEAYQGKCCYQGKNAPQIVLTVVRNKPLKWPAAAPKEFVSLMRQCLAYDHSERPAFSAVAEDLKSLNRVAAQ